MNNNAIKYGQKGVRWIPKEIETIPIPKIALSYQKPFISIVNQIMDKKLNGEISNLLEQELDKIVYKLYQLNYDEILIVDPDTLIEREAYNNFVL